MIRLVFASMTVLMTLCGPNTGHAAIVTMMGNMTSGSGVLGTLPPSQEFSLTIDFTESSSGFATINGGTFWSSPGNISVNGGDILVIEDGAFDRALLSITTSGPTGSLAVTFTGDALVSHDVTTANLVSLINAAGPTTLSANFGSSGNYTGSITSAVPEPASLAVLLVASSSVVFRRRRRPQEPRRR